MEWLRKWLGLGSRPHVKRDAPETVPITTQPGEPARKAVTPDTYEPREPLLHIGRGIGGFDLRIVGESHYQTTLWKLRCDNDTGSGWIKAEFHVVPEPTNPYDSDALKVVTVDGETVGYFSRNSAQRYKSLIQAASKDFGTLWCRGLLLGGDDDRESIGVKLDVLPPKDLLARIESKQDRQQTKSKARSSPTPLDQDGQPAGALNATERAARDVSEVLGLVKGFLADGRIADQEIRFLHEWSVRHPAAIGRWPLMPVFERLAKAIVDNVISEEERADLQELFMSLVGGSVTVHLIDEGASTLPLDVPPPAIMWEGSVFVFTGRFAYGTRPHCASEVLSRGGQVEASVTNRTSYLVVGTFGSRDWLHSAYGRKIERAFELRNGGCQIHIVGEDHWADSLNAAAEQV